MGRNTMSNPKHRRLLLLFPIVLLVAALLVLSFGIVLRGHFKRQAMRQAAIFRQEAEVEAIRERGGIVLLGPSDKNGMPADIDNIDLSNAVVDAEVMSIISQITTIERLRLDGAKLRPEDYDVLGKLSRLNSLSLARTNVTDADVSRLPVGLSRLSLNETSVTDESMLRVAGMIGLVNLDMSDTEITSDGLRRLEPLRTLETLWINDFCITAESVESLRRMDPQVVEVAVREGMGRRAHACLEVCDRQEIRGRHRDGYVLWDAGSAWCDTLAGVAEAVVSEIGLDSQQAAQLAGVFGEEGPPVEGWGRTVLGPLPATGCYGYSSSRPDGGSDIASVDEFIRELQKDPLDADLWALRRFAREKFTAGDVPKLLAAMRAAESPQDTWLFRFGPFLLVRYGMDDPEVIAELDRMMGHEEFIVRCTTATAFSYGGAGHLFTHVSGSNQVEIALYSRDEWTASREADEFAVPRLLRICKDRDDGLRDSARMVLTEIAYRRPEYVSEVMPVLVDFLDQEGPWHIHQYGHHISQVDIGRLAEVAPDVAIAIVRRLRDMLKQMDEQVIDEPPPPPSHVAAGAPPRGLRGRRISVLEALSVTAGHDPALAHEIAMEYLGRMGEGLPAGPFGPLLSPETSEANRMVVMELLRDPTVAPGELGAVGRRIRDWRETTEARSE
jgi:hypothetical protein